MTKRKFEAEIREGASMYIDTIGADNVYQAEGILIGRGIKKRHIININEISIK